MRPSCYPCLVVWACPHWHTNLGRAALGTTSTCHRTDILHSHFLLFTACNCFSQHATNKQRVQLPLGTHPQTQCNTLCSWCHKERGLQPEGKAADGQCLYRPLRTCRVKERVKGRGHTSRHSSQRNTLPPHLTHSPSLARHCCLSALSLSQLTDRTHAVKPCCRRQHSLPHVCAKRVTAAYAKQ